MSVLLQEQIRSLQIIRLPAGEDYEEVCFSSASYDLRVGREFFVPDVEKKRRRRKLGIQDCAESGPIELPPFSAVLLSTYETLKMPLNVAGRWDLKIRWAMAGMVFQIGPQIEPGYEGRLFGLLYNLSDTQRTIRYKERLWAVEFVYTVKDAQVSAEKKIPRLEMKEFLDYGKPTGSINMLWRKSDEAWRELQKVTQLRWSLLWIITTVVLSIGLPLVITKLTYDKDDQPLANVMGFQKTVEDMKSERATEAKRMQDLERIVDEKIAAGEKNFRKLSADQAEDWVRNPNLYFMERLNYLRGRRDELQRNNPSAPELKDLNREILQVLDQLRLKEK